MNRLAGVAQRLRQTRQPKFTTYPNGGTVKSQAANMIVQLQSIIDAIPEGAQVPPWVVMKISQAHAEVRGVHNYIIYYGQKR